MSERIYVVTYLNDQPLQHRLVRAGTRAQALRHVAEQSHAVDVASQQTLVDLVGAGVKVENASEQVAD